MAEFAFNTQWVDVRPYLAQGQEPIFLLERPLLHGHSAKGGVFGIAEVARLGDFWVPTADPIRTDGGWSLCKTGTHARVPILAYRTTERALSAIWGLGLQLGLAALAALRTKTPEPPTEMHMILGHECTDLTAGFRCYVGLAIRTK